MYVITVLCSDLVNKQNGVAQIAIKTAEIKQTGDKLRVCAISKVIKFRIIHDFAIMSDIKCGLVKLSPLAN